jgi:hypothetical protein
MCRALRASRALVLVDDAQSQSRKSGAIYESRAKYKLRNFRAMNFFDIVAQTL